MKPRVTKIKTAAGDEVTIVTDSEGTRVSDPRYREESYGADQHRKFVDEYLSGGAEVLDRNYTPEHGDSGAHIRFDGPG